MLRMDISKYLQTSFYFLLCAFLHFSTLNWQLLHLPSAPSHLVLRTDAHRPCPAPSTLVQPPWTTASKTAGQTRWSGERTWCGLGQVPQTAACGTVQFFSHIVAAAMGRKGKCKWCVSLQGIFLIFNELIQMFYARTGLPSIIMPCFQTLLKFSWHVQANSQWPHHPWARGLQPQPAISLYPPSLPPHFLGQNKFDGYSVTTICPWRYCFVIYALFLLKSDSYSKKIPPLNIYF